MDDVDLLDEFLSYPGLMRAHLDRLQHAGVSAAARICAGGLTAPNVVTAGRLFVPSETGDPVFAIPIYDGRPPSFENPDPTAPLVDLCAFRLDEPERWWLRIDEPHLVLGKDKFFNAILSGSKIILHATPLQWLQAECEGACPLDLAEDWQGVNRMREHLQNLEAA